MDDEKIFQKVANVAAELIYQPSKDGQLFQGDIVKETGKLSEDFRKFYPEVSKNTPIEECFFIIVSQSCDLCYDKISHVNVALVRPLYRNLTYRNQIKSNKLGGIYLLKPRDYNSEVQFAFNMINTASSKAELFLPLTDKIPKNMVALLNQFFSLRIYGEHKDSLRKLLLENRVASLSDPFRSKLGEKIADLYGRVDVTALTEITETIENRETRKVTDNEIRTFIRQELKSVGVFNTLTDEAHTALQKDSSLVPANFKEKLGTFLSQCYDQQRQEFVQEWLNKISSGKHQGNLTETSIRQALEGIFKKFRPKPKPEDNN